MNFKNLKLSILSAFIFFVIASNNIGAQDRIKFSPDGVIASANDTFEVNIVLDSGVVDLFAYSVHLKYDSTILRIIDSYPTDEWSALSNLSSYFIGADSLEINPLNNQPNWYYHIFDILFTNPKKTVDGYFEVSTVKFVALQTGISPLYYEFYKGTDTLLQSVLSSSGDAVVYVCPLPTEPGDSNNDGAVDISDLVWIVDFIFTGGSAPLPNLLSGDMNCDASVDITDLVWIVDFIFTGGPPGCEPCL